VQKVILYIQPQLRNTSTTQDFVRVDLMEEDLIELTQVIQDARDIEKIFTDYSRTFNLPASKTNNKIFKHWYNPDIDGFDNQIFCSARIELNHLHFRFGKIKLEEAVLKNGEISMYKVTFFGDTLTLTELIGEDKIDSLEWLNNFNHSGSNTNVKNGLENGLNFTIDSVTYNDAVIYPLIAHSQSYIFDDTNNLDNGLNISTNSSHHQQRGVLPEDLKPAILVKHIIKAIEQQYNITFKTSEFLDSAAMNNLYMWMHRDKGKLIAPNFKLVNDIAFTCTSASVVCNQFDGTRPDVEFHSNTGIYEFYLFAEDFESKFIYDVTITPESGSASTEYTAQIINLESNQVVSTIQSVTGTQNISISYGRGTNNPLVVGQVYRLAVKIITNTSFNFDLSIDTTYSATAVGGGFDTYTATHTSNPSFITTTADIELLNQVPDIKVLDFLRALFSMHNLTAFLNFNGEVVVKTLDSFYSGGDTFNITPFVKTDKHTVGATVPFSEIDFEYAEPKSILAQQFFNTNNQKYGELNYLADTTKSKKYEIKIPFEHMLFERLQDKTSSALTTVQVGSFLDDNLEPSIGQPLLFYGIYQQNKDNINFLESTRPETYGALCPTGTNSSINDYWIPSACNELGRTSVPPLYNLNFGSEINTYTLTDYAGNNNSLFQNYYTNYITRVFNKKTRIFKFSAVLPLKVLLTLTLDDLIVVGTRAYTINKMSTKLQSGETNFELLNEPN
jgi:hypothetical protein